MALLEAVRGDLSAVSLPLALAGVEQARQDTRNAVAQLDDYILPRYRSLDAPLLAVVGVPRAPANLRWSTPWWGTRSPAPAPSGHHTAAHSAAPPGRRRLVRRPPCAAYPYPDPGTVSREPVPASRAGATPDAEAVSSLVLVADHAVPQGIALLDAPDVDSISDDNRRLAGQLLAAADLWVFVTTANRYADAVPWRLLLDASSRDIMVAVVLDRVPAEAEAEVSADLRALLRQEGLGDAGLFIVPETDLDHLGMLPTSAVEPLGRWLQELAADAAGRSEIARRTLNGTVKALAGRVGAVAHAVQGQERAAAALRAGAEAAYRDAGPEFLTQQRTAPSSVAKYWRVGRTSSEQGNSSGRWSRTSDG
ncbi:ABC transporter protein [Arthrobacter sp. Hiyo4]|nr:ABC transporter protein [Arthrobacter sp. Hiyo4]